ncbi:AAEL017502-PA [Aedes aegypti]|uniref:AAEL017502-PA n=1 Tax=Aedes aegypti TaxID=7159 RepID=J9HF99_AEDAE|nr:AAEL017502-PA [Aedes aegypti]
MKFTVDFQLLLAVLALIVGYVHAVGYEYNPPSKKPPMVKPANEEECHCGYVLEERVELHCKPQKRIVKVLKKKGNCVVNEKPILVDAVEQAASGNEPYRYGMLPESEEYN